MTRTPIVFWAVAALALIFNLFSLYDLVMTSVDSIAHLQGYPQPLVEFLITLPEWRRILWTTTVFLGVIGAVTLLLRRGIAERALWAATVLLALAVVVDYTMLDGARVYGDAGSVVNVLVVVIEAGFALYAGRARRQGLLR
ncbi:hypothetical protein [uncultured Parasphingopyxis sp.]|uniref:hypothetical protein n=1 Tax=uncultured Parasphingopyxis sp. TaxID=1547918 RepID=UPI00262331C2|nr:hypothetical protein [uncultured Parasphingopyxis sp.]